MQTREGPRRSVVRTQPHCAHGVGDVSQALTAKRSTPATRARCRAVSSTLSMLATATPVACCTHAARARRLLTSSESRWQTDLRGHPDAGVELLGCDRVGERIGVETQRPRANEGFTVLGRRHGIEAREREHSRDEARKHASAGSAAANHLVHNHLLEV